MKNYIICEIKFILILYFNMLMIIELTWMFRLKLIYNLLLRNGSLPLNFSKFFL